MVINIQTQPQQLLTNQIVELGLGRHESQIKTLIDIIKAENNLSCDEIELISSGGGSVVIQIQSHNLIYQYYEDLNVYESIRQLYIDINANPNQMLNLPVIKGHSFKSGRLNINYDLRDFLVCPQRWVPKLQTIVWEKIQPVTQLQPEWLSTRINNLIWDIGKAINGLHLVGYSHQDVCLDNIGWNGRHFVLYDFNLTKPNLITQYSNDYFKFGRSLQSYFDHLPIPIYVPFSKLDYQFFLLKLRNKANAIDYHQIILTLEHYNPEHIRFIEPT